MMPNAYLKSGSVVLAAAVVLSWCVVSTALAADKFRVGLITANSSVLSEIERDVGDALASWLKLRDKNVAIETISLTECSDRISALNCAEKLVVQEKVGALIGITTPGPAQAVATLAQKYKVPYVSLARINPQDRGVERSVFSMPVPHGTLETAAITFIRERLKPRQLNVVAFEQVFVDGDSAWQRVLPSIETRSVIVTGQSPFPKQFPSGLAFIDSWRGLDGLKLAQEARSRGAKEVVSFWTAGQHLVRDLPTGVFLATYAPPLGNDAKNFRSIFEQSTKRQPSYYAFFAAAALDLVNEAVSKLNNSSPEALTKAIGDGNLKTLLGTSAKADAGYLSVIIPIVIIQSSDGKELSPLQQTGGGTKDCQSQSNCGDGCCKKEQDKCPNRTCSDGKTTAGRAGGDVDLVCSAKSE